MNLLIISSSQRKKSQSSKVAQYLAETIAGHEKINHIELCQYELPLWDGEQSSKAATTSDWHMISQNLRTADALIVITPEWSGMASPLLKNVLLMCSSLDTAHKPVLMVSISSGISGAYPIAELRMNAFKNNKLVAIPDHLIIRNVTEVLNSQSGGTIALSEQDTNIRHRINYSLHTLHKYSQALASLRNELTNNPFENEEKYSYGM